MELKVKEYTLPEKIECNFEELERWVLDICERYETTVYTDEQIRLARSDRAELNKLRKMLNDERIKQERAYMQPFLEFKTRISGLCGRLEAVADKINEFDAAYKAKRKEEKWAEISKYFESCSRPEWLELEAIADPKWLNASVKLATIAQEITERITAIERDLLTLSELPAFAPEAIAEYKRTLDFIAAFQLAQQLTEGIQQELEPPKKAAPKKEKFWIGFQAYLSVDEAKELKHFFESRNIEFEQI